MMAVASVRRIAERRMARKPIHFSKMSAEISGENTMSPTRFPSSMTGNDAPIWGIVRR
jgi:hypothetical protein